MVFSSPEWRWRIDQGPVKYGFVNNLIRVCPARGREVEVYVVVPTEVFQLLPTVFGAAELEHIKKVGAEFYLDEDDGLWIMGIESVDNVHSIDLWPYTKSQLPPWVDLALRKGR